MEGQNRVRKRVTIILIPDELLKQRSGGEQEWWKCNSSIIPLLVPPDVFHLLTLFGGKQERRERREVRSEPGAHK